MEAQAGRERCQRIGQTTEPLRGECHAPPPHHRAGGVILRVYIGPSQSQGWEVHAKAPGRGEGGGAQGDFAKRLQGFSKSHISTTGRIGIG